MVFIVVVQLPSRVQHFMTPQTAVRQASLSLTISQSLPKFMSFEQVMLPNHLILCHPLLVLPSIFPNIRVFSNESAVTLITKLSKTRRSSRGTFACQKLHHNRKKKHRCVAISGCASVFGGTVAVRPLVPPRGLPTCQGSLWPGDTWRFCTQYTELNLQLTVEGWMASPTQWT